MRKPGESNTGYGIPWNENEGINSSRSSFDGNSFSPRYGSIDNSQTNDRLYFKIA